jgi:phage baseplate assembly protein gpV
MSIGKSAIATLAANIRQGIANRLKDLHTSMPGIIESFDPATQTASIQPTIKRVFITRDGITETLTPSNLPLLINVPIQFPRGGGFSLTFPVTKGDECLIMFAERAIDTWHKFGGIREPNAKRFHSLSDATAIVGLSSLPNKVPSYSGTATQVKKDDGSAVISLNNDSSIGITSDSDITVTSLANIKAEAVGNITATCANLSATASGSAAITAATADITASSACTITAPTITLAGNVIVGGTLAQGGGGVATMSGGADITGPLTNNGKDVGSTHTHPQAADSGGDSEQNTGTPV